MARLLAGPDTALELTETRVSGVFGGFSESSVENICSLSLFFEDSDSGFEEDSVTAVFCSIIGFDSAFASSSPEGALVLPLFTPGLVLMPGLGLLFFTSAPVGFTLLAGGSGGFPANGFKLLFLRKRV